MPPLALNSEMGCVLKLIREHFHPLATGCTKKTKKDECRAQKGGLSSNNRNKELPTINLLVLPRTKRKFSSHGLLWDSGGGTGGRDGSRGKRVGVARDVLAGMQTRLKIPNIAPHSPSVLMPQKQSLLLLSGTHHSQHPTAVKIFSTTSYQKGAN